jgi:hypothetical protein
VFKHPHFSQDMDICCQKKAKDVLEQTARRGKKKKKKKNQEASAYRSPDAESQLNTSLSARISLPESHWIHILLLANSLETRESMIQ